MITEDYVSLEIARLLKDKGFNEYCMAFRSPSGALFRSSHDIKNFEDGKTIGGAIAAPTLQTAMKWLREIHLILYIIYPNLESGELRFSWRIHKLEQDKKHYVEELPGIGEYYKDSDESFTTYKDAEESLIKYCLKNLI